MANNDQFRKLLVETPAMHARAQVNRKQREILRWLGFPATEALVRLFKKIRPEAITPHDARLLLHAVVSEPAAQRLLAHQKRINSGILGLVCNLKLLPHISPTLLAEVALTDDEMQGAHTADLLIDAMYTLNEIQSHRSVPCFKSIEAVREFSLSVLLEQDRTRLERRARRSRIQQHKTARKRLPPGQFPPPPIPGTEDIIPLTTKEDLKAEGAEQQNCVATYARRVRSGGTYIYRVLRPVRATLSIVFAADGAWRRSELKCAQNTAVSWTTRGTVDRWLSRYSVSA